MNSTPRAHAQGHTTQSTSNVVAPTPIDWSKVDPNPQQFDRGDHAELSDRALEDLRKEWPEVIAYAGSLYGYRGGIFQRIPDKTICQIIKAYAGMRVGDRGGRLRVNSGTLKGTKELLHAELDDPEFFSDASPGIAFADGFVHVTPQGLGREPHSPEHRARHAYPFAFDGASEPDLFHGFLDAVFRDDADREHKIRALQEFMGAAIAGIATRYERALMPFGPGSNGKTRLCEIVKATMPPGSVVTLPPSLMSDQYTRSILAGARLNVEADIPDDALGGGAKGIISGEQIQCRDPGSAARYFSPRCAHLFGCNKLPSTKDTSDGFWRRWLILPMTRDFRKDPKRDPDIVSKIVPELPGIVRWALDGAVRLLGQSDYTLPVSHELTLARWRQKDDSVRLFVEMQTTPADSKWTLAADLYAAYREWISGLNGEPISLEAFGREMTGRGYPGKRSPKGQTYGRVLRTSGKNGVM